jgi:hypothetical protein
MTAVIALKAEAGGRVGLGITVNEEDFEALEREAGG